MGMTLQKFEELVAVMAKLRGEGGCPWDREQTYETIKNYLIEETYEVVEVIEENNYNALQEELGDILLQVIFLSQIAQEQKRFTINDVISTITSKMIRRHPHVFGDVRVRDSGEVLKNWEQMKQAERLEKKSSDQKDDSETSILDGVTKRAPAVLEASQLSQRAARVGFDWSRAEDVLDKLDEEIRELREAVGAHSGRMSGEPRTGFEVEAEIGDILFVIVNLARHFDIDAESALKKTNQKFRDRFRYMENRLAQLKRSFEDTNLEELEQYWQEAKRSESTP